MTMNDFAALEIIALALLINFMKCFGPISLWKGKRDPVFFQL